MFALPAVVFARRSYTGPPERPVYGGWPSTELSAGHCAGLPEPRAAVRRRVPWLTLANLKIAMRINVGQAKTDLSKLLARAEVGEDVEIARDGVPIARLVPVDRPVRPGERFLAAHGSLAGEIWIADD
jgi:prevent-host-death family protein